MDQSTVDLINEFLELERRKEAIMSAAREQKKELTNEQKPIKAALKCRNKQHVLLYKMIIEANPDTELLPEEFAEIIAFWTKTAIEAGIDDRCAKYFSCPQIYARSIVDKVEQQFNIKILD